MMSWPLYQNFHNFGNSRRDVIIWLLKDTAMLKSAKENVSWMKFINLQFYTNRIFQQKQS